MIISIDDWIRAGYEIFSFYGMNKLKVETVSKRAGISKSSFYHHFADMEIFTDLLLQYHLKQAGIIAEKELNAGSIDPELINIMIEHKTDLLFNRQLRVYRDNPKFLKVLNDSNKIIGEVFIKLWLKDQEMKLPLKQVEALFELALDNFFLQITPENLNLSRLKEYFASLKRITGSFR